MTCPSTTTRKTWRPLRTNTFRKCCPKKFLRFGTITSWRAIWKRGLWVCIISTFQSLYLMNKGVLLLKGRQSKRLLKLMKFKEKKGGRWEEKFRRQLILLLRSKKRKSFCRSLLNIYRMKKTRRASLLPLWSQTLRQICLRLDGLKKPRANRNERLRKQGLAKAKARGR